MTHEDEIALPSIPSAQQPAVNLSLARVYSLADSRTPLSSRRDRSAIDLVYGRNSIINYHLFEIQSRLAA
jgi:hypothetical protein